MSINLKSELLCIEEMQEILGYKSLRASVKWLEQNGFQIIDLGKNRYVNRRIVENYIKLMFDENEFQEDEKFLGNVDDSSSNIDSVSKLENSISIDVSTASQRFLTNLNRA